MSKPSPPAEHAFVCACERRSRFHCSGGVKRQNCVERQHGVATKSDTHCRGTNECRKTSSCSSIRGRAAKPSSIGTSAGVEVPGATVWGRMRDPMLSPRAHLDGGVRPDDLVVLLCESLALRRGYHLSGRYRSCGTGLLDTSTKKRGQGAFATWSIGVILPFSRLQQLQGRTRGLQDRRLMRLPCALRRQLRLPRVHRRHPSRTRRLHRPLPRA